MTVQSEIERSTAAALELFARGRERDAAQMVVHASELAEQNGVIFNEH